MNIMITTAVALVLPCGSIVACQNDRCGTRCNIFYCIRKFSIVIHETFVICEGVYLNTNVCSCSWLESSSSSTTTRVNFFRLKSNLIIFGLNKILISKHIGYSIS